MIEARPDAAKYRRFWSDVAISRGDHPRVDLIDTYLFETRSFLSYPVSRMEDSTVISDFVYRHALEEALQGPVTPRAAQLIMRTARTPEQRLRTLPVLIKAGEPDKAHEHGRRLLSDFASSRVARDRQGGVLLQLGYLFRHLEQEDSAHLAFSLGFNHATDNPRRRERLDLERIRSALVLAAPEPSDATILQTFRAQASAPAVREEAASLLKVYFNEI